MFLSISLKSYCWILLLGSLNCSPEVNRLKNNNHGNGESGGPILHLGQGLANFFSTGPDGENIFGTVGHVISVTTTQLRCYGKETTIDNI